MPTIGLPEILALLLLALLIFGPGRLTKLARELGQSIHAFQAGLRGESDSEDETKPSA